MIIEISLIIVNVRNLKYGIGSLDVFKFSMRVVIVPSCSLLVTCKEQSFSRQSHKKSPSLLHAVMLILLILIPAVRHLTMI